MDGYALRAGDAAKPGVTLRCSRRVAGRSSVRWQGRRWRGGAHFHRRCRARRRRRDRHPGRHDGGRIAVTLKCCRAGSAYPRRRPRFQSRRSRWRKTGQRLTARDLSLLAAGDLALVKVRRRPQHRLRRDGRRTVAARRTAQTRRHRRIVRLRALGDDRGMGRRSRRPRHPAGHAGSRRKHCRRAKHADLDRHARRRFGRRSRSGPERARAAAASRSISGRSRCGPASR